METINIILGIIASGLSISAFIFTKKVHDRNKIIEYYLKKELNISLKSSKKELMSLKKAISGENGTSVIGDQNQIKGGKRNV